MVGPGLSPRILGASPSGWPPVIKAMQPLRAPQQAQEVKCGHRALAAPHCSSLTLQPSCWAPCLPVKLPRWAPHLSLQLLADGSILADVTVQTEHVALKLREGHRRERCVFIQGSFWQPLPIGRHCVRCFTPVPQTHPPPNWRNRSRKGSGLPEATARGRRMLLNPRPLTPCPIHSHQARGFRAASPGAPGLPRGSRHSAHQPALGHPLLFPSFLFFFKILFLY